MHGDSLGLQIRVRGHISCYVSDTSCIKASGICSRISSADDGLRTLVSESLSILAGKTFFYEVRGFDRTELRTSLLGSEVRMG